jgi:hypothetical protein
MTSHPRRPVAALRRVAALVLPAGLAAGLVLSAGTTGASAATKTVSLSGVTLNFGDQLKEYQTIFAATNALQGAQYKVNWSDFIGGPPVSRRRPVARSTSATWPRRRRSSPSRPVTR